MTSHHAIDLHAHTLASDGSDTPPELVRAAAAAGIRTLAVTDHDTVEGVRAALAAAGGIGVEVLPGCEITGEVGGRVVHLLAYGEGLLAPDAVERVVAVRRDREQRNLRIGAELEALAGVGYADALELAGLRARAVPAGRGGGRAGPPGRGCGGAGAPRPVGPGRAGARGGRRDRRRRRRPRSLALAARRRHAASFGGHRLPARAAGHRRLGLPRLPQAGSPPRQRQRRQRARPRTRRGRPEGASDGAAAPAGSGRARRQPEPKARGALTDPPSSRRWPASDAAGSATAAARAIAGGHLLGPSSVPGHAGEGQAGRRRGSFSPGSRSSTSCGWRR